jgi:hypothetical protein
MFTSRHAMVITESLHIHSHHVDVALPCIQEVPVRHRSQVTGYPEIFLSLFTLYDHEEIIPDPCA